MTLLAGVMDHAAPIAIAVAVTALAAGLGFWRWRVWTAQERPAP
jgi:hypothetical protein